MENNNNSNQSLESYGIEDWLVGNLNEISVTGLFPVQQEIVPFISRAEGHDICVCAPTGSGKTLAYAIPLVQKIVKRVVRRIRVVVIVPTHDLVIQVEKTFQSIIKGTDLIVQSLGVKPFHVEQKLLVKNHSYGEHALYESLVDIIVSTPGRLVDHINETQGFTLKYLNYLVIDEADRLLRQSFQDWLEIVIDSTNNLNNDIGNSNNNFIKYNEKGNIEINELPINIIRDNNNQENHLCWSEFKLVKLLLSATMTYNPSKISLLQLNAPLFFTTSKTKEIKYTMPSTLKESYIITNPDQKPLVLLNIIYETLKNDSNKKIICFTKSVDITHRLNSLLKLIGSVDNIKFTCEEYSSALSTTERSSLLNRFKSNEINVLICSDIMSRGMDISDIDVVINYNSPPNITLYVHRVGRTARAGKHGFSYTIIDKQEIRYYISMMKKAERSQTLHCLKWKPATYEKFESNYKLALNQMRLIYSKRKLNEEEIEENLLTEEAQNQNQNQDQDPQENEQDEEEDDDNSVNNSNKKLKFDNSSINSFGNDQESLIKLKQSLLEISKKKLKVNFNL
ncbi:hypothetical protein DICPUDRAFT_148567 [Dictyostelium purpureum]|uniref:ATP-dependent RNA helicase n=1 Tax=Dictyostelium purpureum TaxID=5786 RepID=F0ZBG3_DICPU|nr:uncharacterized protein DICPUDRAFT_148567 [Dictyostelium purpureum]EGC38768.1 hypothetical protein DICPUDRAFT_148567 [Dictyostelium purpureum]|eukprot:XP_003284759.1 hypothetical protein DICPUDRAFT_148567 [Dictyostelium purpureum]